MAVISEMSSHNCVFASVFLCYTVHAFQTLLKLGSHAAEIFMQNQILRQSSWKNTNIWLVGGKFKQNFSLGKIDSLETLF